MKAQETKEAIHYSYRIISPKPATEIFALLSDVKAWWSGLYEETIVGESQKVNDKFSFEAGGGVHYSKQELIEVIPNKRLVWRVIESNLSFLEEVNEWDGTVIRFELNEVQSGTEVLFTHQGLVPSIECYASCSSAWSLYMDKLSILLNTK